MLGRFFGRINLWILSDETWKVVSIYAQCYQLIQQVHEDSAILEFTAHMLCCVANIGG